MTREQHLAFCKKCLNRKLNMQVGLVCSLTGEKANFESECPSFQLDESVVIEKIDDVESVDHSVVLGKLSNENLAKFKSEQDYPKALIVGIIVGILGAALWGMITVITSFQIGYMAIAVGAGVGFSMRVVGKGIDPMFGITGGAIALFACVLGNFFSSMGFVANAVELSFFETLGVFDYSQLLTLMGETFSPIDLLFYGIAAYAGYRFSFRTFTEKDVHELGN